MKLWQRHIISPKTVDVYPLRRHVYVLTTIHNRDFHRAEPTRFLHNNISIEPDRHQHSFCHFFPIQFYHIWTTRPFRQLFFPPPHPPPTPMAAVLSDKAAEAASPSPPPAQFMDHHSPSLSTVNSRRSDDASDAADASDLTFLDRSSLSSSARLSDSQVRIGASISLGLSIYAFELGSI